MAQLLFGTNNSVTFGTTNNGTSATLAFNKSSLGNIQVGDLLVAWIHNQASTAGTITPPAGWTHYGAVHGAPSLAASRTSSFYYYPVRSQADITNLSATPTWTISATPGRAGAVVARATGIDLDNIEDSESAAFSSGSGTSLVITGITTVKATTLLVAGVHHQNSASTTSPSVTGLLTGFQEYKTAPTGSALGNTGASMGYQNLTSAGATGNVTATFDTATTAAGGELVAFKAGSWTPPNLGVDVEYTSAPDTLTTGHLYYTSATDTLTTPAEVRPVPTGYPSVAAMLATTPFYVAHRGSSGNWPEMSLYAYTQSVFWGMGALEVSLARTSDGVWFGLHDDTLDRTSGTTGFVASEHTWAEVQAYSITAAGTTRPGEPARPYMRWEELMAAYYETHVIFVDPKGASAFSNELLNMMDAMPGTPTDRFVAKYYGVSSIWANAANARNYTTWGYFYQADSANFATFQGKWDILGMDYNADGATWTAILSYGKPVIGHTIPNATAATTALGFGASGLMISGVEQTVPRTP